ncbi:MAG: hypothetical protein RJB55_739, partial [Verrucomicrobiota bacterium]
MAVALVATAPAASAADPVAAETRPAE